MFDILRPYFARVFAGIAAGVVMIVARKFGLSLSSTIENGISDALMLITYAVVHKLADSHINPVDAARIETAKASSDEANG